VKTNGAAVDAGTFDFIVTGAGSAGCCVAARLSENGRYRVLLLEAGGEDRYWWIHVPVGYSRLFANPRVNWMFESEPEPELEGRSMYQPRGKVLGGTSSINGMVYMRGNPADYDLWRQRGCVGWDWDSLRYTNMLILLTFLRTMRPNLGQMAAALGQRFLEPASSNGVVSCFVSPYVVTQDLVDPRVQQPPNIDYY
jgi:hypothetical protein